MHNYSSICFQNVQKDLPPSLQIRALRSEDYYKGLGTLLGQLTTVGSMSFQDFQTVLSTCLKQGKHILVIEDMTLDKIVATGSIVIEHKLIHSCGKVGHIEDVVVNDQYRGQHIGKNMIRQLMAIGRAYHVYKFVLQCDEKNVPFYESLDFRKETVQMVYRRDVCISNDNDDNDDDDKKNFILCK